MKHHEVRETEKRNLIKTNLAKSGLASTEGSTSVKWLCLFCCSQPQTAAFHTGWI